MEIVNILKADYQLEKINEIAKKHGGTCISKKYTHSYDKYMFKCDKGHIWKTTIGSIRNGGSWCPTCRKEKQGDKELEILHQIARERGGECLTNTYINSYHKLTWKCKEGHVWKALPGSIKTGTWCKKCVLNNRVVSQKAMDEMRILARNRGGECLSTTYERANFKLTWKCKEGHVWESPPATIRKGSWCPKCAGVLKLTMDDMHKVAKQYGGKCLSSTYINKETKLKWECAHGHQWMAMPGQLLYRKSWCPTCYNLTQRGPRKNIDDMKKLADSYNGDCLSDVYMGTNKKLKWQCKHGHMWEATPSCVKQGKWCPHCPEIERKKEKLKRLHAIANERGGQCLATEFMSGAIKMTWVCAEGHTWQATPYSIRQGTWCARCSGRERPLKLTIKDMQNLAGGRGGYCLSSTYSGLKTELKWMCKERHAWFDKPNAIRKGKWCPICETQPLQIK